MREILFRGFHPLAEEATPELHGLLVPLCEYCGGVCHEMEPCGRYKK